jgi:hypothetical protein
VRAAGVGRKPLIDAAALTVFSALILQPKKAFRIYNLGSVLIPVPDMNFAIASLLLLCLYLVLGWGMLSVIQNLSEEDAHDTPTFREQGPIFHDHYVEQQSSRSQFAWQSRSHWKAPD